MVQLLSDEDYKCSVYILFVNSIMKVIYDWNLSNNFLNVKMYIRKNTTDTVQLGLKDMYRRLYIELCIFAIMIFFPLHLCGFYQFYWYFCICLHIIIYSYDIMLEQMWNKPCISDVAPPPSTPDISPDYNPYMNLSYPPFPECVLCAVVCMLISRLFNVIYS